MLKLETKQLYRILLSQLKKYQNLRNSPLTSISVLTGSDKLFSVSLSRTVTVIVSPMSP